jgi:hypothetical protein
MSHESYSTQWTQDVSSLLCDTPSPSSKLGVPGGKKVQLTTMNKARRHCVPYQRHPSGSPPSTVSPPNSSTRSRLQAAPASSIRPFASSSVSSSPDNTTTPDLVCGLRSSMPRTPIMGFLPLPDNHAQPLPPHRLKKPCEEQQPSTSILPQTVGSGVNSRQEGLADRYCRYAGCNMRFPDKRTTMRHRLTHLDFGTYVCPNPACDSRTKTRPNFASDFTLKRHFKAASTDSLCAAGRGHKLSSFKIKTTPPVEVMVQQALVPFDPTIHTPF